MSDTMEIHEEGLGNQLEVNLMGSAESRESREDWRRLANGSANSNARSDAYDQRARDADTSQVEPLFVTPSHQNPSQFSHDSPNTSINTGTQSGKRVSFAPAPRTPTTDRVCPNNRLRAQLAKERRVSNSPLKQVQNAADLGATPPDTPPTPVATPVRRRLFALKTQTARPPDRSSRTMPRRSRAALEDDDDMAGPSARRRRSDTNGDASDAASNASGDAGAAAYSSHDVMVKKLVRLALAYEVSRKPIRRADISEKVMGNGSRAFKKVFDDANKQLEQVFGMKMTELPQKDKVTMAQKRNALRAGTQSQGANASSNKIWILTTTLGAQYRRAHILPPVKMPSESLEAQYVGLYTMVVTVILLSNSKRISDNKLDSYLSKLNAGETVAGDRTEKLIKRMEKDGYITKIRERDGGEETIDWVVGPRGKIEVGEKGAAGMVRTVYGSQNDELNDLEDRLDKSLGEGTFKRKTAGGVDDTNGDENGDGDAEMMEVDGDAPRTASRPGPRRSTRRSQAADDDVEEGEGEEEEEEEEEDGEEAEEDENGDDEEDEEEEEEEDEVD